MSQSNFPNSLDYPDNSSYFSELSQEDWQKIKRYNSLLQKSTGLSEDEQAEMATIISELKGKRFTAQDINKLIDCIRAIEKVLYPISKGNIEGNLNVKGNVDVSGNISGNGSKLTNVNADTVDGKHATDFASFKHFDSISAMRESQYEGGFSFSGDYGAISGYSFYGDKKQDIRPDNVVYFDCYMRLYCDNDTWYLATDYYNDDDGKWTHNDVKKLEFQGHKHKKEDITDFPTSMKADGGNADTVGGKSISDLLAKTNRNLAVESTDFNTITDMGVYTIGTEDGTEMSTGKNQPVGAYQWGTLAVFASGSYGLTQVYYTHTGDTYVRGLYGDDNWNSWKKCGENADTLDGKHATDFYPQGSAYGSSDFTISNGYNKIIAGNISGVDWGMNICKESDEDGIAPSLFVSESGRNVCSYKMGDNGTSNTYSTSRRTLSVGACATIVVAASDTYPESAKFSADYICNGTNDQNTINAAINTLSSSQGGKVILLNGTYNLSNGININKNNVTIEGMGYSTYLKCDNAVFKMKAASSLSHISIKNLRVYTIGNYLLDFAYSSTVNCTVIDLNLENITNDDNESGCPMLLMKYNALTTTLVNYLTINNCKFLDSYEMVLNRCHNIIFTNNIVNSSEIFGIYYCNNAMVSNNKFSIYSLDTSNNINILIQNNLLTSYTNPDSTNTNVSIINNLDI